MPDSWADMCLFGSRFSALSSCDVTSGKGARKSKQDGAYVAFYDNIHIYVRPARYTLSDVFYERYARLASLHQIVGYHMASVGQALEIDADTLQSTVPTLGRYVQCVFVVQVYNKTTYVNEAARGRGTFNPIGRRGLMQGPEEAMA